MGDESLERGCGGGGRSVDTGIAIVTPFKEKN
jgi:hypothetical protein